jgi:thiaminase/transcriptional activator TenA
MYKLYQRKDFAIPKSKLHGTLKNISEIPPSPDSLFCKMWNSCEEIAKNVLETRYFKGITEGNLDPNFYGSLMVQDAYYCMKGRDAYSSASTHAYDQRCEDFLKKKCIRYDEYNEYYSKIWHIREAESVIPNKEIRDYANYEAYVAGNLESPYTFTVMLPCEYLWTWIANQLCEKTSKDSLYYFWVKTNSGEPTGAYQMANLLEEYRSKVDEKEATTIFKNAMQHELNVFKSVDNLEERYDDKKSKKNL